MAPYVRAQKNLQKAQRHETSRLGVIEVESKQDNTLVHEYRAASPKLYIALRSNGAT